MKALFFSRSLPLHLARGLIGAAAIVVAVELAQANGPWWAIPAAFALGFLALAAFGGCPMCWTAGLIDKCLHRTDKIENPEKLVETPHFE